MHDRHAATRDEAGPTRALRWLRATRRRRRGTVAATYLSFVVMVALFWLVGRANLGVGVRLVALAFGAVNAGGFFALCTQTFGIWQLANNPDDRLDERERQVRDRVYRLAYVGVALALCVLAAAIAAEGSAIFASAGAIQALCTGVVLLVTTLPAAALAWTEADPAPESDPEASAPGRAALRPKTP